MNFINNRLLQVTIVLFTILSTIAFALISPFGTDSGWIANTTQRIANTGEFLWTAQFVNIAFGKVYFYLNSLLMTSADTYFILKLFPVLFTLISILLYYKFTLALFKDKLTSSLSIWLIIIFGASTSIMLGLRTEGLYVPILFILFYLIYKYDVSSEYRYLYLLSILTSLSAITHPNGFVLVGLLLIYVVIKLIQKEILWIHILFNTILILSIVTYGLLWQTNLIDFIEGFNTIANDKGHTIPFYKEYLRYISFMKDYTYLSIPLVAGLYGLYLYIRDFFKNSLKIDLPKSIGSFITYGAIFVFIYLIFIGAKWGYYLSLLFPFLTIGLLYIIKYYDLDRKIIIMIKILLILLIINLLLSKLPKNEEFLRLAHIPSARIAIVNDIQTLTKNKIVLAPARSYYMFHNNSTFIQIEKMRYHKIDKTPDYVLIDFGNNYKNYESKLGIKLLYLRSFVYNDAIYNLFEVRD